VPHRLLIGKKILWPPYPPKDTAKVRAAVKKYELPTQQWLSYEPVRHLVSWGQCINLIYGGINTLQLLNSQFNLQPHMKKLRRVWKDVYRKRSLKKENPGNTWNFFALFSEGKKKIGGERIITKITFLDVFDVFFFY